MGVRGLKVGPARWGGIALPHRGGKPERVGPPPIPPDMSSFEFFFGPVFPLLTDYWWEGLPNRWWGDPWSDADFVAMTELVREDRWVPPGTLFPEFGRYVGEGDWMELLGYRHPLLSGVAQRGHADVSFHNVDGAYWIVRARDATLLRRVAATALSHGWCYCEDVEEG